MWIWATAYCTFISFWHSCMACLLATNIQVLFVGERLLHLWKIILSDIYFFVDRFCFLFQYFWICLPTTSSLNGFWWEISFNLIEGPCYFQNSSFMFAFALYYNVSQFRSLLVYPTLNTLSLLGMQIHVLNISSNLGKSVITFSVNLCFSFSSSLLSGILTMSMLTRVMVSHKSLRLYLFASFYFLSGPMIS